MIEVKPEHGTRAGTRAYSWPEISWIYASIMAGTGDVFPISATVGDETHLFDEML